MINQPKDNKMTMYAEGYEKDKRNNSGFNTSTVEIGELVFYKKEKLLQFINKNRRYINMNRVSFLSGQFNRQDAEVNFPKPTIISESGERLEQGDKVLYTYIEDSPNNILILGSIQNILHKIDTEGYEKNLTLDPADLKSILTKSSLRRNKKRIYEAIEDSEGNISLYLEGIEEGTGDINIKVKGTPEHGKLTLELNGRVEVLQKDKDDKTIASFIMDNTEGKERIDIVDKYENKFTFNEKGTIVETKTVRIGKDITLKTILDKLFDALQTMTLNTPTGTTIPQPLNWAKFEAIKADVKKFMDVQ